VKEKARRSGRVKKKGEEGEEGGERGKGAVFLEKAGTIRILLSLLEGESTMSELREKAKCPLTTLYTSLVLLRDLGLLKVELTERFPRTKTVKLTERGRRVAELLKKIDDIIKSSESEPAQHQHP
jgi:DNA-binding HxlR family transcriptional regulator